MLCDLGSAASPLWAPMSLQHQSSMGRFKNHLGSFKNSQCLTPELLSQNFWHHRHGFGIFQKASSESKHSQGGETTNLLYMSYSQLQGQLLHLGPVIVGTKPQQARKAAGQVKCIHLTRGLHVGCWEHSDAQTMYVVICFDIGTVT